MNEKHEQAKEPQVNPTASTFGSSVSLGRGVVINYLAEAIAITDATIATAAAPTNIQPRTRIAGRISLCSGSRRRLNHKPTGKNNVPRER